MLPMRRYGEPEDKSVFRSERFFCIDGQWFVYIRESKPLGPFDSRHEARIELDFWLRDQGVFNRTAQDYDQFFAKS